MQLEKQSSQQQHRAIPPVRSIHKSMHLDWHQVPLHFVQSDPHTGLQPIPNADAQGLLQQQAQLEPTDGDLARELDLLEDQVDNLLQDNPNENVENMTERQQALDQGRQGCLQSNLATALAMVAPVPTNPRRDHGPCPVRLVPGARHFVTHLHHA